jgi:hypothetical protein
MRQPSRIESKPEADSCGDCERVELQVLEQIVRRCIEFRRSGFVSRIVPSTVHRLLESGRRFDIVIVDV